MSKKKPVDPIPEEFSSYEEAAQFWETHDTTDYPEDFHIVEVNAKFRNRRYEIEVEADVVKVLQDRAKRRQVSISHLANDLLRQQLVTAK